MARYLAAVQAIVKHFVGTTIQATLCDKNVFYEVIKSPSVPAPAQGTRPEVLVIGDANWREPILNHLTNSKEPEDPTEAKRLKQRARNYVTIDELLYKGGVCTSLLLCISR